MQILFVSDLNNYSRGFWRYRTLVNSGYKISGITTTPIPWRPRIDKGSLLERLFWKLKLPIDSTNANKKIKEAINKGKFDIIWIEKGNTIKSATLRYIKKKLSNGKLISVSEDDMFASHSRSLYYNWGLKYYDVVFTTKVYNLNELKLLGAKRTELFLDAYDENLHKPIILTDEEKKKFSCNVGFIGSFENDRAEQMLYLAKNGIKIVIWGLDWDRWMNKHYNLIVKNQHLYFDDYSKAINATKINLCFLRKINRDEVTSRSVEIPACGGFMIAEKTKRHYDFFEEDKEVVFFGSKEELLEKVKKYLIDDEARLRIAKAGRKRCIESGYSMKTQLSEMIAKI